MKLWNDLKIEIDFNNMNIYGKRAVSQTCQFLHLQILSKIHFSSFQILKHTFDSLSLSPIC